MGEKDLWLKLGLIVMVVALSVSFIYPPQEKLKPGIDLGGGHSLLFEIDDSGENIDKTNLSARVMDILKQRVDPGGNRNLIWRPIGRNRLEIQMPQPPANQRETRENYEKAKEAIADTQITRTQIVNALNLPAAERDKAINELVGKVESRRPLFKTLVETSDKYAKLAGPATSQPSTQAFDGDTAKAQEIDRLFVQRNDTINKLLQTNLDPRMLADTLELDRTSPVRQKKMAEIKETHKDLDPLIDNLAKTQEAWSKHKGYLSDPADLMRLLRGAGKLEFRIVAERDPASDRILSDKPEYQQPVSKYMDQLSKFGPRPQEGDYFHWFEISKPDENTITHNPQFIVGEYLGTKYVLAHATADKGLINDGTNSWKLRGAHPDRDQSGRLAVAFALDVRGGSKFGELTGNNINRPLGIFLDDKAVSAPNINSQITTNGIITGKFTPVEVNNLVQTLEAGVLPARLKEVPLQEKSVGPGLGETNRNKGVIATAVALLVTLLFMAVYYTYSGFIANIALLLNFVITLGVMAFMGCTFTLPGMAGLILTLGMAVDANVLIYERVREEMQRGVSAKMAVRLGYEKAFSAILDGNVTTIITAVILAYLGSEEIKGFGQTLGIGLCISMFTALFVTRQYFNVMLPATLDPQETRRIGAATIVVALLGGAFLGLGYVLNAPDMRADSGLIGVGKFLMIVFATAAILVVTLWLFHFVYKATGHQRANRLPMMKLLSAPKVDWMSKRHKFWIGSAVVVFGGLFFAWYQLRFDASQIMDIEFIGGTSVQVEVKDPKMKDEALAATIVGNATDKTTAPGWLRYAADQLKNASVTKVDEGRYLIKPADKFTTSQLESMLVSDRQGQTFLADLLVRGGIRPAEGGVEVAINPRPDLPGGDVKSADDIKALLAKTADYMGGSADRLRSIRVQLVKEQKTSGATRNAFEIVTTETNKRLVAESLLVPTRDILDVTQPIEAKLVTDPGRAPDGLFPIEQGDNTLADVLGAEGAGAHGGDRIEKNKGGVLLVFDNITPATSVDDIKDRLKTMRLQPDFEAPMREVDVIGLKSEGGDKFSKVAIAVADPSIPYSESGKANDAWRTQVAEKERDIAKAGFATSRSLQRVTQFAPQVANEAAMKAIIAVLISLIAIAIYVWARFGSAEFGLSGIIALYHDVAVALAAVIACHFFHNTALGHLLGLSDFRIDLSVIAALLTIVGFSINDTIVIFDRIRENRGRMATISSDLINRSLNETMSRTIITTFTVLMTVIVMYAFGGEGIHAFAFTMLIGCISGTYSTIAIATPLVHAPRTMWGATIVIAGFTLIGLATAIANPTIQTVVIILIAAAMVYAFYRMVLMGKTRVEAPAQPAPVA